MAATIRVLVVDDSALIRQMVSGALALDPMIEVVGVARDGVEAIEKIRRLGPDVVTLDVEMPELSGVEALPHINRDSDARVIMLSSLDDPDTTYQALSAGAVDFIGKPRGGFASSLSELSDVLIKKVKTAYRVAPRKRRVTVPSPRPRAAGPKAPAQVPAGTGKCDQLVVIAASTGGPPALETVFSSLSVELPAAYLVVQHLPEGFTASLAKRLGRVSDLAVVEAEEGMRVEHGVGYVAPHGSHMVVVGHPGRATTISLDQSPPMHGVRPAADPLFESAAVSYGEKVTGVVMTGMGADGAAGLASIRQAGGHTVAQDEESSVVWGMPGAAVKRGAVENIMPLDRIAMEIRRTVRGGS